MAELKQNIQVKHLFPKNFKEEQEHCCIYNYKMANKK